MASFHYIYAPMNASKSAQFLMTWHNYEERKMNVLTVKPKLDSRDGQYIKSRALNIKRKAKLVIEKDETGKIYDEASRAYEDNSEFIYDVVLVDEAQFLTKEQVDELGAIVDDFEIPVMAYGLLTDSDTNLFEGSKRLIEIADKLQEFKTVCPCCGSKAIFNMRIDEKSGKPIFGGEQISPGTNYLPVCRKYYNELKERY